MFRKSFAFILAGIVFGVIGVLWFYQNEPINVLRNSPKLRKKKITLEVVESNFSADYKLPEYKYNPSVDIKSYLVEVSNIKYEIPEDSKLSNQHKINSARYQFLCYYLAKYAQQLDCLKYKGMKEYIDNILKMEYEPYSINPADLKAQGESFLAGGLDNMLVRFGIGIAYARMKKFNKAVSILKQVARRTVRDKNCPGIASFYICGRLASLSFNWYLSSSNNSMVNNLSDQALAKAFKGGEIRPCDTQSIYRIITNSRTAMSMSRTLKVLTERADFPEYFINLLKGTALINKAWIARGYRLGMDYGQGRIKFLNYLEQAEIYLKKSYMARPDLPEAATCMITVAMTKRSNEHSKIYWFNKAVKAQNDYMDAYRTMLDALYYNWTECSNQPIIYFAEALKNCHLYNTEVSIFYINALEAVAKTTPSQKWRLIFCNEQTKKRFDTLFANYFKQKLTKNELLKLKTLDAVCMLYAGEYFKADAILKKIPDYIKKYDLDFYDALNIVHRPDIQLVKAEIALGTGKDQASLKMINKYCAQDRFKEAGQVVKSLIQKYSKQPLITNFLFRRLIDVLSRTQLRHQGSVRIPLFLAVRFNKKDIVKTLLDSGANPNELDSYHRNALSLAASYSNTIPEIIELLLKAGTDLSIFDNLSHDTPLHKVLQMPKHMQWQREKLKIMINYCKNFKVRGPNSLTVLDYAIHYSTPEIVGLMIKKGADPNLCDNDGWSPVYRAALINKLDIIKALVNNKANINIPDRHGHTALDVTKSQAIRKFLIKHGAKSGKKSS